MSSPVPEPALESVLEKALEPVLELVLAQSRLTLTRVTLLLEQ